MGAGIILIAIFCFLIFIGVAIFVTRIGRQTEKIDVTANMPLIENICRSSFTNGYTHGVVKSQLPRNNGTNLIEFYPIDVEQGEGIPRPNMQSIVVLNPYIKRFSKGEMSSRREIIKLVGRSSLDYPEKMRKTIEGDYLTKEGQLAWIEEQTGKGIQAGDETISEIMKRFARGNPTKHDLAQMREEIKEKSKALNLKEQEEKKGSS